MAGVGIDYEQQGYEAATWWLVSCPYSRPHIRDAWQRGAWKWQEERREMSRAFSVETGKEVPCT